jgi:hypothetical protein
MERSVHEMRSWRGAGTARAISTGDIMARLDRQHMAFPAARAETGETGERILHDLRAFAQDLGIAGASAMEREELVESLRQRYLLESMLRGGLRTAVR